MAGQAGTAARHTSGATQKHEELTQIFTQTKAEIIGLGQLIRPPA